MSDRTDGENVMGTGAPGAPQRSAHKPARAREDSLLVRNQSEENLVAKAQTGV